jgi:hypothetical protein
MTSVRDQDQEYKRRETAHLKKWKKYQEQIKDIPAADLHVFLLDKVASIEKRLEKLESK